MAGLSLTIKTVVPWWSSQAEITHLLRPSHFFCAAFYVILRPSVICAMRNQTKLYTDSDEISGCVGAILAMESAMGVVDRALAYL
jgi:hypothetical protein